MTPTIKPVETTRDTPAETTVVVIGAGIIGLTAALNLAERGVPVVVLEKGRVAGEQSSRNLGWIRKLSRSAADIPLAQEAEKLWTQLPQRTGMNVGYRQAGIMYVARTQAEMAAHEAWLKSVAHLDLDARLVSAKEVAELAPGTTGEWIGGIYMPSDGYAEPEFANTAIAAEALKRGAKIVENCAVRGLSLSAGRVTGVVTENGEIKCDHALLAGGLWSRRFLKNHDIALPTLPMHGSVIRTDAIDGPTDIAVGASNFSFRKRHDGGYTVMQRGALDAPLTPDHILIGLKFIPAIKANWRSMRVRLDRYFFEEMFRGTTRSSDKPSPFERQRTMNPLVNQGLLDEAMTNLRAAWPIFKDAKAASSWAGLIDITPDSEPVISPVAAIPGLTLATGFSGHGFGTGPAAGQLAADLVMGETPLVDPTPYRFDRFQKA